VITSLTIRMMVVGLLVAFGAGVAQGQGVSLPVGNADAGKEAARAMQCHVCHEIVGSGFPAPHAELRGPVLGAAHAGRAADSLAAAILAPSHDRAEGQMGDYSEAMTVRQLIDIVAYLRSLGG
jgi:hypothetical protein